MLEEVFFTRLTKDSKFNSRFSPQFKKAVVIQCLIVVVDVDCFHQHSMACFTVKILVSNIFVHTVLTAKVCFPCSFKMCQFLQSWTHCSSEWSRKCWKMPHLSRVRPTYLKTEPLNLDKFSAPGKILAGTPLHGGAAVAQRVKQVD